MSNLIVAIIGAALFTGILVYGSMLMGPKIEEGRVAAAAAQAQSELGMVASAVSRMRFARQLGPGSAVGSMATFINAGYLERVPINPVDPARGAELIDAQGRTVSDVAAAGGNVNEFNPRFVAMSFAGDQLMCTWFARYVGSLATQAATVDTTQVALATGLAGRPAGCFRTSGASGGIAVGEYLAYVRI